MSRSMVAEGHSPGLGRYRFRETLSTSFFGPRYRVVYEGSAHNSDAPPGLLSDVTRSSLRPSADMALALRLVEVDAPSMLERLAQAVSAVRDVDHRAVLRPLQIVRGSTRLGIVTPHVEGLTLSQLLHDASVRGESMAPAIAVAIVSDVVAGLSALAEQGRSAQRRQWTCGGITPDSILVGSDGQARLLDPGVAAAAARQPVWSHEASALAYTAPEQTGADANYDEASDTFALGVILWELLSCRMLFRAPTAAETLERVHRAPIPRVQRQQFVRGEPIAFALAQTVNQALRRDPKQRFNYYTDFARALAAVGEVASRAAIAEQVQLALAALGPSSIEDAAEPRSGTPESRYSLPAPEPAPANSVPPEPERVDELQLSAAAPIDSQPPAAAVFEPPTERMPELMSPSDSYWPANPNWTPTPESPEKISAHPLGDLLRTPYPSRTLWSTALAGAAVLGLFGSIWALLTPGEPMGAPAPGAATLGSEAGPASATARPPLTAADAFGHEPGAAAAGGQPAAAVKLAPSQPVKPAATNTTRAATSSAIRVQPSNEARKSSKLDKIRKPVPRAKSPAEPEAKPERTTFIPDDI